MRAVPRTPEGQDPVRRRRKGPCPHGILYFRRCRQCRSEQARVRYHNTLKYDLTWLAEHQLRSKLRARLRRAQPEYRKKERERRRDKAVGPGAAALAASISECQICDRPLTSPQRHVDHDHETGRLRGVLCFSCNVALARFDQVPNFASRATAYLAKAPP